MNEIQRDDQKVATTMEQQVEAVRNMQLARRTARASCMPASLFDLCPQSITQIFQYDDQHANIHSQ